MVDAAVAASAGRARRTTARWYRPRNILFASGGSLLAAIAAVVIVLMSADPNEYRGIFEQTIRSATGREVTIAASISPSRSIRRRAQRREAGQRRLGSRPQMVVADRVEVQMALMPLFHGTTLPSDSSCAAPTSCSRSIPTDRRTGRSLPAAARRTLHRAAAVRPAHDRGIDAFLSRWRSGQTETFDSSASRRDPTAKPPCSMWTSIRS